MLKLFTEPRGNHGGWWRVALFSCLCIAAFFVTWEAIELRFLGAAPPNTRTWLYLARGIFGAICIGIVTAFLVRRHERRIALLRHSLIESEKLAAIGQMAAGLAHEIGNPLTSISSVAQLIERHQLSPADRDRFKLIHGEVERIHRIVLQLVDFSRPAPTEPEIEDIRAVIKDAVELARYDLRAKHIRFDVGLTRQPMPVLSVREHMIQVFLNVIYNAMDAMPDGGVIQISGSLHGGEVLLEFCDAGAGIAPEQLEHVFHPFFTTKSRRRGSGLGLAVTRQLLLQHSGRITLESQVGVGTKVRIVLPAAIFDSRSS